jgi:hypothetical protein
MEGQSASSIFSPSEVTDPFPSTPFHTPQGLEYLQREVKWDFFFACLSDYLWCGVLQEFMAEDETIIVVFQTPHGRPEHDLHVYVIHTHFHLFQLSMSHLFLYVTLLP